MKFCSRCKGTFPLSDFHGDRSSKDGKYLWCKVCNRDYRKQWAKANPERMATHVRRAKLKHAYGISMEEYGALLLCQRGRCAICDEPQPVNKNLSVDHDHETGRVRGLLCSSCNLALGGFRDDPKVLRRAIEYVTSPPSAILTEVSSFPSETAQQ